MKKAISILCACIAAALVWVIGGYVIEYFHPQKIPMGRVK